MSNDLVALQQENAQLKQMAGIINSDSALTAKVKHMLDVPAIKNEFLALLPDAPNKEQIFKSEIQSIIFDIMESTELQQCTPASYLFCLKSTLARGLRIGKTHKEAWLISSNNKKKDENGKDIWVKEARMQIGYRAYINKAWNDYKIRLVVGTITKEELLLTRLVQTGTNRVTGEPIMEQVPCIVFDRSQGKLEINIPLGKESKLHTSQNIEYVYVTSIDEDGNKWSDMFSKEAIEEKSKTTKWDNGKKVTQMGQVWRNDDVRLTDYKEMLHKGAIISFCKMMPSRGLNELADFDHRQLELEDITPKVVSNSTADLNSEFLAIDNSSKQEPMVFIKAESFDPVTGELPPVPNQQEVLKTAAEMLIANLRAAKAGAEREAIMQENEKQNPNFLDLLTANGIGRQVGTITRLLSE